MMTLGGSGYELATRSPQPDPSIAPRSTTPSFDGLIIPSSQRSLEEFLTIPEEIEMNIPNTLPAEEPTTPSSQHQIEEPLTTPTSSEITTTQPKRLHFAPRVIPSYSIDRSDFPSWLLERGRLDYVLSVEAGDIWKKLITVWLKQERRLGFGLNENIVRKRLCEPL